MFECARRNKYPSEFEMLRGGSAGCWRCETYHRCCSRTWQCPPPDPGAARQRWHETESDHSDGGRTNTLKHTPGSNGNSPSHCENVSNPYYICIQFRYNLTHTFQAIIIFFGIYNYLHFLWHCTGHVEVAFENFWEVNISEDRTDSDEWHYYYLRAGNLWVS